MDADEFALAMFLVEKTMQGNQVPSQLPPNLLPQQQQPQKQSFSPVSSSSSGNMGSQAVGWAVSPQEKAGYDVTFASLDTMRRGFLSGQQAVPYLQSSRMPTKMLEQIWDLVDMDKKGHIDSEQFAVALHLINQVAAGMSQLPPRLPPNLIPPNRRGGGGGAGAAAAPSQSPSPPFAPPAMAKQSSQAAFEAIGTGIVSAKAVEMSADEKRRMNFKQSEEELIRRRRQLDEENRRVEQEAQEKRDREERERREVEEKKRREKEGQLQKMREAAEAKLRQEQAARRDKELKNLEAQVGSTRGKREALTTRLAEAVRQHDQEAQQLSHFDEQLESLGRNSSQAQVNAIREQLDAIRMQSFRLEEQSAQNAAMLETLELSILNTDKTAAEMSQVLAQDSTAKGFGQSKETLAQMEREEKQLREDLARACGDIEGMQQTLEGLKADFATERRSSATRAQRKRDEEGTRRQQEEDRKRREEEDQRKRVQEEESRRRRQEEEDLARQAEERRQAEEAAQAAKVAKANPFATIGDDPFASKTEASDDDPFASASGHDDPFATAGPGTSNPFGDDPFGSFGASAGFGGFQPQEGGSTSNPFDSFEEPASRPDDDPFADFESGLSGPGDGEAADGDFEDFDEAPGADPFTSEADFEDSTPASAPPPITPSPAAAAVASHAPVLPSRSGPPAPEPTPALPPRRAAADPFASSTPVTDPFSSSADPFSSSADPFGSSQNSDPFSAASPGDSFGGGDPFASHETTTAFSSNFDDAFGFGSQPAPAEGGSFTGFDDAFSADGDAPPPVVAPSPAAQQRASIDGDTTKAKGGDVKEKEKRLSIKVKGSDVKEKTKDKEEEEKKAKKKTAAKEEDEDEKKKDKDKRKSPTASKEDDKEEKKKKKDKTKDSGDAAPPLPKRPPRQKLDTLQPPSQGLASPSTSSAPPSPVAVSARGFVKGLYDYEPRNPGDLSFKAGQRIRVLVQNENGWWEGSIDDQRGYFPVTYVGPADSGKDGDEDEDEDEPSGPPPPVAPSPAAAARVQSKDAQPPPLLAPSPASLGQDKKEKKEKKEKEDKKDTKEKKEDKKDKKDKKENKEKDPATFQVRALYDYQGAKADDLTIKAGEVLTVLVKEKDGWMYGKREATREKGWFPETYVERADSLSASDREGLLSKLVSSSPELLQSINKQGRFLVYEGPVTLMAGQAGQPAFFFLMSDCLVTANPPNAEGKYEVRNVHLTQNYSVADVPNKEGDAHNYAQLKLTSGKNIVVAFASPDDKAVWLEAFAHNGVEVQQ